MTIAYADAFNELFAPFNVAWQFGAATIVAATPSYTPEVRWPGLPERDKPPKDKFWVRVSQQTLNSPQSTLSNCVGEIEQRRYETSGLLFIQLFCPQSVDGSLNKGRLLAQLARNAYRGKTTPGGIWFRNVTIKELPSEEAWLRLNVNSEYEFDELG